MEQHADEPLTPQELARAGCMSVRTLHSTFQQALGESPMSYLRRIRLDHAKGLSLGRLSRDAADWRSESGIRKV
jgi:transcriptional regulator GlxA family with amidase domain